MKHNAHTLWKMLCLFLFIPMAFALTACGGDDEDEPAPNPDGNENTMPSSDIEGVWFSYDPSGADYIKFGTNNRYEDYSIGTRINFISKYTYDASKELVIIHYYGNQDCDIYHVSVDGDRLSLCWLDDVADRYTTDTYSLEQDMRIINQIDSKGYDVTKEDTDVYVRSSEEAMRAAMR